MVNHLSHTNASPARSRVFMEIQVSFIWMIRGNSMQALTSVDWKEKGRASNI